MTPWRWLLGLAALTALVYARVWSMGWYYDDGNWLPLLASDRLSDQPWVWANRIGGGWPWAYHGLVLALHLLNGVLFYALIRRWLSVEAALVAVTAFWLWPIQVASVAYVSGGREVLLLTYLLLAALGGLQLTYAGSVWGCLALCAAFTMKLSALPAVISIIALWAWARLPRTAWAVPGAWIVSATLLSVPAMAIWILHRPTSWLDRLTAAGRTCGALGALLTLLVRPWALAIDHDWSAFGTPRLAMVCLFATVGLVVMAWRLRASSPFQPAAWAALWAAGTLLPRALVPTAPPLLEPHTYVSFAGIWIALGAAIGGRA